MLKNSLIIGLLCYNADQAQAITRPHGKQFVQYRPFTNGRTPWYSKVPEREPEFEYNYKVPSFGVDRSVQETLTNAAQAEKRIGHKFNPAEYKANFITKWVPTEYTVPNFGADKDVVTTQKHLAQAETKLEHKWTDSAALAVPAKIPRGYKVANFGQDREITGNLDNLAIVEKRFKHKLSLADVAAQNKPPVVPAVHDYGMDHEIKTSLKNLQDTEKKLGVRFTGEFVQTFVDLALGEAGYETGQDLLQLESDPIQNSAGNTQYSHPGKDSHPMNYYVPNFGMDSDIADSMTNMQTAETGLGREIPVPKKEAQASLAQVDLGVDAEIMRAQQSIKEAEYESDAQVEMGHLPEYM